MRESRHGNVRHCLRRLTNRARVEKIGLSGTVAAVNAGLFHRDLSNRGALTLETSSQRHLDFLPRTLERLYRSNSFAVPQSRPRMILLEATFTHIKSDGYPADQFRQNYH
jgi:hypothetical protein